MERLAVSLAISRRTRPGELLLVERNKKLRYFGGFLAFPGGTLDSDDSSIPVDSLDDPAMARFVVAGARELFEETGIWFAHGEKKLDPETLRAERRRLLAEDASFREILDKHGQRLRGDDLKPLCRITTPPFSPVRFDTWFLRGVVPDPSPLEIWDGELTGGSFVDPGKTLSRWRNGEIQVAPPMVVLLEEWAKGEQALGERIRTITESYRAGKLHRVYFSPGVLLAPLRTPTQPPATHTNTCIVGEERMYLVDPSPFDPDEQRRLWDLLDELHDEGRKLEGILLTHYHRDHIGALDEAQTRYDVPVYAHADCLTELPDVRSKRALGHGDTLELGRAPDGSEGWKLEVLHVPGHAHGHLAFQESRYGAIIVGDLVSTLSSILIDPEDGHLSTYLRSLESLRAVTTGTLYPGHGPPVPDGKKVIEKTLRHRAEREEQLINALTGEPQSSSALVEAIYTDLPPAMHALAERSLLSGLAKLEEEGRIRRTDDGFALC